MKRRRNVNWHSATVDALKIDLRDYADVLEYQDEYALSRGAHRIDLLVIRKKSDVVLSKMLCKHFQEFNLFEIKGIHSSLTTDAYYKTNGYAGIFIDETGGKNQYLRRNLTLNFISRGYPRKLIHHLQADCEKKVEKIAPGIYDVEGEMYSTKIIVTSELDEEEYLYLKCLTDELTEYPLIRRLTEDYKKHSDSDGYINYMHKLLHANAREGERSPMMICEGIFELFGTSSEEIIAKTKKQDEEYYQPLLKEKESLLEKQAELIAQLRAENERLRQQQA